MKMLVLFLASWLVLAQSATLEPEVIELGMPIMQEEILPDEIPREVLLQRPLDNDELEEFDIPLLVNGEPQTRLSSPLNPRGRRPSCNSAFGCTRSPPRYRLDEFPPAQPDISNIGNICNEGRKKLFYGPWNLPQTGFGHLSRQGDALNSMEDGLGQCCQLSDREKLPCCQSVWSDVLEQFCDKELSIKTRPYHCCKLEGASRDRCFDDESLFPNYNFKSSDGQGPSQPVACSDPSRCIPLEQVNPPKLLQVTFPPGEPTSANIKNICKLRKFRPTFPASIFPRSRFGWLVRRAQAVNRLENAFRKCCRKEDAGCAHKGWENVMTQYCKQEFSVKTRPHFCCKVPAGEARYGCFARLAPYPAYDQEIQQVNLGQVTPDLLDSLCGQFTLLTKQRNIPALVQNITEPCCKLQGNERTQCAEDVKSQFIVALCSSQKKTWKDPKECCPQLEGEARSNCFNVNYLNNVSIASSVQITRPTVPVPVPSV
nr:extracellular matrix protein 1 [Zootoca vivipara]